MLLIIINLLIFNWEGIHSFLGSRILGIKADSSKALSLTVVTGNECGEEEGREKSACLVGN